MMSKKQDTMGKVPVAGHTLSEEVPVGYKRTEMGVMPSDWTLSPLSEVAPLQRGFDLPTSQIRSGPYPVVYSNGVLEHHDQSMVKSPGVVTGRSGTIGKVHFIEKDYWPHNTSLWVTSFCGNDPKFIYYLYTHINLARLLSGSGVPTLNRNDVHQHTVVCPPPIEQRAIAEALSDVDRLLDALEELIAKKRAVKQAAMQQLLTGKIRLSGFSEKWETTILGDVADLKNGYAFKSSTYVSGGMYQIITIANVQDGHLSLDVFNTISELPLDLQDHQQLRYGDILISMTGNVGRVCIVKDSHCLLNQRVGKLVAKGIDPLFLYYIVHDRRFLRSMIEKAVGGAQGNLGKSDIVGYTCFLPKKLVEQSAIAAVLFDMDAEITALEQRRDKARTIKQGMMQELLTGRVRLV